MAGGSVVSKTLGGAGFLFGNVLSPIMTYQDYKNQGKSTVTAVGGAVLSELFYSTTVGQAVGLAQMGIAAAQMTWDVGLANGKHSSKFYKGQFGGNYDLSSTGYTLRQRGAQAIQRGAGGINNALGSEARTYHRRLIE